MNRREAESGLAGARSVAASGERVPEINITKARTPASANPTRVLLTMPTGGATSVPAGARGQRRVAAEIRGAGGRRGCQPADSALPARQRAAAPACRGVRALRTSGAALPPPGVGSGERRARKDGPLGLDDPAVDHTPLEDEHARAGSHRGAPGGREAAGLGALGLRRPEGRVGERVLALVDHPVAGEAEAEPRARLGGE